MNAAQASTPLRELDLVIEHGVAALGASEVDYADGSEQSVLDKILAASDISSLSDELRAAAENVHEEYHFSLARANGLRALAPRAEAWVLEIGAGCGSVTRWLGETHSVVDALEPMPLRARAAAARTRDLPSVRVFCGDLQDVPPQQAYDLVVLNGVLEYVAGGGASEATVVEFLQSAAALLAPEGVMYIAIENRLGAKYLAGAPEDHTGRIYDGVDGYPIGTHARTFARAELDALLSAAGLERRFLHAFPDYKHPRALFDDELLESEQLRPLAWRTPIFPSPGPRPRHASELRLWESLVRDGVAARFSNSFVVLAGRTTGAIELRWPRSPHLAYFSTHRRAEFATITELHTDGEMPRLVRKRLMDDAPAAEHAGVAMRVLDEPLRTGVPLPEYLAGGGDPDVVLPGWRALVAVHRSTAGHEYDTDCLPQNCLVHEDGSLSLIDQEFSEPDREEDDLIIRGLAILALSLVRDTHPERWEGTETVADLVALLARSAQADLPADWPDRFIRYEHELWRALGSGPDPSAALRAALSASIAVMSPLGERAEVLRADFQSELARALEFSALAAERLELAEDRLRIIEDDRRKIAQLEAEVAELHAELAMRLTARVRRRLTR